MLDKIIEFSLRNRIVIIVAALIMMGAGYYSYTKLPVDAFPDVSPNLVQVFTVTDGLAPEEIEKYVTYPVEAAMAGLPGVEKVRSVSNFGLSVVNIYFEDGMNIYFARQLVGERLTEAREQIPPGFGDPEMGPISTGMGLVLFYYLEDTTGLYSLEELRSIQDWLIKFNLQTVPGVTEVLGIGGFEKQFHIEVHPEQLLRYGVTLSEVIQRIRANNLNVGAQFIEKNSEEFVVRSIGLARDMDDLRDIVIRTEGGRPIYLGDLAEVKVGGAIRRGMQSRNGTGEVVAGQVIKLFGANSSAVIERVEERLAEINGILPEGLNIVPYYEQKTLVQAAVKTVTDALLQGVLLVALVLLIFMGGIRPSIVVALSLPFSVLFAFLMMGRMGMTANLMSLGGLAIAIGMMVDGTIVMIENVDRHLRDSDPDKSKIQVISAACREVARPILFAIGIIILVFVPLFTLQGVEGKTFRPLAYTVALAMLGSLIFAIGIAPMLSSFFMKRPKPGQNQGEARMVRWLLVPYRPVARFFVDNRWAAVVIAGGLLVLGALVVPRLGSEFTPRLQEGTIVVRLTMVPSIALTESEKVSAIVERRLMKIPEVREVISRIGRGEVGAHTDPVNSAEIYVILHPQDQWRTAENQEDIENLIREEIGNVPGVLVNLTQPIAMTVDELMEGVRAELAIKLFGDDLATLKASADDLAAVIREVPGAADVQVDQVSGAPQLQIRINREAIARYGLNVADIQEVVKAAVGGEVAGQIFEGIRRFDILVRYVPEARDSAESIKDLLITTPDGLMIPLSELTTTEEIIGSRQITRENNQRFISIQCNVVDRDIGSFVAEAQEAIDAEVDLPPGYLTTWGGQFRLQQEASKRMSFVVPIVLLFLFLLLFGNFGSVRNSVLILINIPLALVGGVVALWLSGMNMSVPASIGLIALFGIALENGMVLITYMNQLVAEGMDVRQASIQGACLRLRPVLMTAITTALGLLPLLFSHGTGSEVQQPLATVVIGGLVSSTLLTLVVLPALYKWFMSRRVLRISGNKTLKKA